MLNWFEKHPIISWFIVVLIAITIFIISSISFGAGTPGPEFPFKSYVYHFSIYFLLALFLVIASTKGNINNKEIIFIITILAILYSISDEIHQYFVPFRYCSFADVCTDSVGIILAVTLYVIIKKKSI